MSLNRYEQMLFNYWENHPDEGAYWKSKVLYVAQRSTRLEDAVADLNAMFWDYFEERARFESPFREAVIHGDAQRISMRNLAEYLLRIWAPPFKPKRSKQDARDA